MAVELVAYNPRWGHEFAQECSALRRALGDTVMAIHHVGSTAIPGMVAKPVIDILCEVNSLTAVDAVAPRLQALGYAAKGEYGIAGRRYFQKKDPQGARTHHVHIYGAGDGHIERHLAFRDFLLAHPATAAEYAAVKQAALATPPFTRQAYQDLKAPFIIEVQATALQWYRLRNSR